MRLKIGLLVVLALVPALWGQSVVRRVSNYVLVDTDTGIGKTGETVAIYRSERGERFVVGHAQIARFQKGMAALKVVDESAPYRIQVGEDEVDQTVPKPSRAKPKKTPSVSATSGQLPVIKVVQDYALLEGDAGQERVGQTLEIRRRGENGEVVVGTLKVHKVQGGKTVGRILTRSGQGIRAGDFATLDLPRSPVDDLDYYFFGAFEGR